MTSDSPSPESNTPDPETVQDEPENSSDGKKLRDCFYCEAPADAKPFKVWVHHKEKREEGFVNVPRCKRCYRRHEGWFWISGPLFLVGIALIFIQSKIDAGKEIRIPLVLVGVGMIIGGAYLQHHWKTVFQKLYGYAWEEKGLEHPMIQNFVRDGHGIGPFPRDEQGRVL